MGPTRSRTMENQSKHLYGLIELTNCANRGEILRSEMMTPLEAERRNAQMGGTIIEWQLLKGVKP